MPKLIAWGLGGLALVTVLVLANTGRQTTGLALASDTPEERLARLSAHWQVLRPAGAASGGGAILLSGCDGVRDNMRFWADEFLRQGRVALILDSHGPRNLDQLELWRLVCAGQVLDGGERAGDLAVALHALEGEGVTDDVVILGASHGGWTAMEFVTHAAAGARLPGLTHWPAPPQDLLPRVSGLVLLYPYCGILNGADGTHWPADLPTLAILAETDRIVGDACLTRLGALRDGGASVEAEILPGVDHGFDQQDKALFSTLAFDAAKRDEALGHVRDFLLRLSAGVER